MAYNDHTASRCCSSRADFATRFVTSVGFLVAIITIIHSYMKNDDKSRFPKDGAIKGTR